MTNDKFIKQLGEALEYYEHKIKGKNTYARTMYEANKILHAIVTDPNLKVVRGG